MSIILNECAWAERMIEESSLGDNAYETLCRVAKYYKANGAQKTELRKKLEEFLRRCDPYVSIVLWSDTLEKAVKVGMKYAPVMIEKITVTQPEMETILKLNGIQLQRLAFTLLCIAKYMMAVAPKTDGWVNTPEETAPFSLLRDYTERRLGRRMVVFMQDGEPAIEVRDFRDLGNQFMMYLGKPYFVCQNCGLTVKVPDGAVAKKMKYCPDCATKVHMQQMVNAVMRSRRSTGTGAQAAV